MDGLVDKIVDKYSEDLLRLFPLQKIFAAIMVAYILLMVKHGVYLSALESVLQLSLKDLWANELQKITLGLLLVSIGLVTLGSFIEGNFAVKVSRFIAMGMNLEDLSAKLHLASKRVELSIDVVTALANECSDKLERKKANLAALSSLTEFLFIVGFAEMAAGAYDGNLIDFSFSIILLLIWLGIRVWLVFRFIGEILPLEAHYFGIRGIPYELNIERRSA